METDLIHVRRWLFEDFKARAALLVPPLLEANPQMGAFDLMAAIELAEAPIPLGPDRKAYLLDLYLVARWAGDPSTETAPNTATPKRRRSRSPARGPRRTKVPF